VAAPLVEDMAIGMVAGRRRIELGGVRIGKKKRKRIELRK
jgi:hypothetical protein